MISKQANITDIHHIDTLLQDRPQPPSSTLFLDFICVIELIYLSY